MAFKRKVITLTFQLGTGTFGTTGFNTLTISGLRVQASISLTAGPQGGLANLRIHGLDLSTMNQLSSLLVSTDAIIVRKNQVTIAAGDEGETPSIIFSGQMMLGQIDMNAQPDSVLNILALGGRFQAIAPAPPISYPGPIKVAEAMHTLATAMGYGFIDVGVTAVADKLSYAGTALDQMNAIARDYGFSAFIENETTMFIIPAKGVRTSPVPIVSKATGMVGYPSYAAGTGGISVKTVFNPAILVQNAVKVESTIPELPANGTWQVFNVVHDLESETPGGQWFTRFEGASYDPT